MLIRKKASSMQKCSNLSKIISMTSTEKKRKSAPVKKKDYLIVDGYNMIFAWEELSRLAAENLDAARHILMDVLSNYRGYTKCELVLVFDGYKVKGNYGEKSDMFRNSLRPEDMHYFEEEIKVKKIAEFVVANAKVKEEVCDCDHDHDHDAKTAKKTTKKVAKKAEGEEVAEEVAAEAPKKRGRKPKAETAE